jgi:hypothetical protein
LVKLEGLPDGRHLPNNTVLVLQIRFDRNPRIYTYLALKVGGLWFFTGRGPHEAGWGAVERWLIKDDKIVVAAWTYHLHSNGEISGFMQAASTRSRQPKNDPSDSWMDDGGYDEGGY